MVHLSDHGDLIGKFLGLPYPKMFMFGEESWVVVFRSWRRRGVELAMIDGSGHFPMYSNPVEIIIGLQYS